ncbi:MAG: ATP-binding protein [Actinobacteria bacterium]|nr:MAG: ATP-binding protein [Actinomycetota bacterium]
MGQLHDAPAGAVFDSRRMERSVMHTFKPHARAAAKARAALTASLDLFSEVLDEQRLDDLRLLTSELVSNSVRHGGSVPERPIRVRVSVMDTHVRVSVVDSGPGFAVPEEPGLPGVDGGWGLFLVDRLADRWGTDGEGATTVWFELDRPTSK